MAQKNNNVIPMTFDDAFYRKMANVHNQFEFPDHQVTILTLFQSIQQLVYILFV
jgi:hypothetical protein